MPGNKKPAGHGFPFWLFSPSGIVPSGIAVGLQPEAPTRGFEPNCCACFGRRVPPSVRRNSPKPHAASTRPRHHGKDHLQSVDLRGQRVLLVEDATAVALHTFQANDSTESTRQDSHWLNLSPLLRTILPLILDPPAPPSRRVSTNPRQSQKSNSQPSHARPKRTHESQPGRPTRADALAWDLDWVGGSHNSVGRQLLFQTDLPPSRPHSSTRDERRLPALINRSSPDCVESERPTPERGHPPPRLRTQAVWQATSDNPPFTSTACRT